MKSFFLKILIPAVLLAPAFAMAHPVSFKGSKGVMGFHSPRMTHNQINYSFQYWWAAGVHHLTRPDKKHDKSATVASTNFLLKRWNTNHLQANIYMNLGGGHSELTGKSETAGYGLLQFDIEDRDYYFLAKHSQLVSEKVTDLRQSVVRAGITPYVDGYDGFHTWLILEYSSVEFLQTEKYEMLTPMLRFFYRNILFEIGQSFDGSTQFNYIAHF